MLLKLVRPMKFDTTVLAVEKPHVLVTSFMVFSVTVCDELFATNFTNEGFFSSVDSHVVDIGGFVFEDFSAGGDWALIR